MASQQFPTTTHYVLPTENDVAPSGYEGYGRVLQELTFAPHLNALGGMGSWVVDGFDLPGAGAGITGKTVTAGEAVINGHRIATHTTGFSIDLYDNVTNYIYLVLLRDLLKVTEVVVEVHNTEPAAQPGDSVFLGTCLTSSGSISTTTDRRPVKFFASGSYIGDDNATQNITVPSLGNEYASVLVQADHLDTTKKVRVVYRCNMDALVFVTCSGSTLSTTSDTVASYLISGGFIAKPAGDAGWNKGSRRYFYWVLA